MHVGKWEAQKYDDGSGWIVVDEFDNEVCQVFDADTPEETEARAKAIAAALDMRAALKTIAETPLWGEALPEGQLRTEYAEGGEYHEEDKFTPSSDTECSMLRDAVELARHTLGLPIDPDAE